jgi:Leucine-rich repeat (LRR) protein
MAVNIDLSRVSQLSGLYCSENQLITLDLSMVPGLQVLDCERNPISELDIRPLKRLRHLSYDAASTHLIQRPDQHYDQ